MAKTQKMDMGFAMFNCHINNAFEKAKAAFIAKFSQKDWDKHIQPLKDNGIMTIFHSEPTKFTKFFAEKVQAFVNGEK